MLNICRKENGSQFCAELIFIATLLLFVTTPIYTQSTPQPSDSAFSNRAASTLLRRLSESLQGHSEKKFLALFDLQRMKDGPLFKQQIDSFFAQTESITVHLNLAETSPEGAMAVDAEMEIQPLNGGPASRRNERLAFSVARAGQGWKFVDLQPRSFFSLP